MGTLFQGTPALNFGATYQELHAGRRQRAMGGDASGLCKEEDQRGDYAVPVKLFMSEVVYEGDLKMVQACNLFVLQ